MEDVLREYSGDVCRFYFLSSHFRKQTEYSRERLDEASRSYERLRLACFSIEENLEKTAVAKMVGTLLAQRAKDKGIEQVVFDRSGYLYHGRVKALAEGAREGGLVF